MKLEYNPRNFLRLVPIEFLRPYFEAHNTLQDFNWSAPRQNIDPLYHSWLKLPAEQRQAMSVDFQRVCGLASRQGIQTILAVGQSKNPDIAAIVKTGRSSIQKVFRVLLEEPEIFRIASQFAWADNLRRYWFHRGDLPPVEADLGDGARLELKAAISAHFLETQGRGEYCWIDHQVRGDLHYWLVYLADHPSAETCFEGSDQLQYSLQQRAFDVVFIFDNRGRLEMYAEGGSELRRDLAVMFARHLLRKEVVLETVVSPVFDLGRLKEPGFRFDIEPADRIKSMRLLAMKLMSPDAAGDRIAFSSSPRSQAGRLHGWIKRGLNARDLPLASLKVENVEIQAILDGGNWRSASVRFSLTSNNACNLKDTPEHDRIRECLKRSEVMLTSPLDRILKRADVRDHVITYDEVHGWPKDDRAQILTLGLLRRADDATSVACDACGVPHDCEIAAEQAEEAILRCPNIGSIRVSLDRLRCWEVDLDRLASLLAAALKTDAPRQPVLPGRLWLIGKRVVSSRTAEFFLAHGSHWPDGIDLLHEAPRLGNSPAPIILCPDRLPQDPEWQHQGRALFSLAEVARLDDSGLVVPMESFQDRYRQIATRLEEPITPTPVERRSQFIEEFQKKHNNCTLAQIHHWANVDRGDLNRWKNGHRKVPDGSAPASRIEKLLQFGAKYRE